MSTEGGGPKSMLKSRAENFARHLQNRLRSLSESEDGTWVSAADPASLSSSSENETFFEIDSNITSPEEEITEPEYTNYVENRAASPSDVLLCNEEILLSKRDSVDEQFYDSVDDINRCRESSPQLEVCQCKPVSLPFPIPVGPSRSHRQYRDLPDDAQINGNLETSYLDAELSNTTRDSDSRLDENHVRIVVVNCNGHIGEQQRVESANCSAEKFNEVRDDDTESKTAEYKINRLQDIPITTESCTHNTNSSNGLSTSKSEQEELELENQKLIESELTMNDKIDNSLDEEEKLSISDLLQVIHKELQLEGKAASSDSAKSSDIKSPQISISEAPAVPESLSSKTSKPMDDEEEDIETRRLRFRRCSSLKSGKTPPGTPGRKKIVRFADVLGLDLADVKTFLDEVPTIPKSAYEDLYSVEAATLPGGNPFTRVSQPAERRERIVVPLFQQPGGHPNFIEKVRVLNVCLENAVVTDPSLLAITGMVRVKNIDFHKSVHIRYTLNSWKSFADLQARYVPNSCDGFSDKFSFLMYAHTLTVGQRLEFAVRFQSRGVQYWDNNGGVNYVFECVSQDNPCIAATAAQSPTDGWPAFY